MSGYVYIQVLAMCMIAGAAAGWFQLFLWRNQNCLDNKIKIKIIAFYIGAFWGVLAFLKGIILGGKDITLFESFCDISARTYLHYLPLLAGACVVLPLLIKFLFRKKNGAHILSVWLSWLFMITAIVFVVTGKISNLLYLCLLAVSAVLTFVSEWKIEMKDGTFSGKVKRIWPSVLFWIITTVVYLPGEIYLNNIWEFHVSPGGYAQGLLLSAMALFVVFLVGAACFLSNIQAKYFSEIVFALTFMGYLQNLFLNGALISMDGTTQTWTWDKCLLNGVIWIVVIAGVWFAGTRFRDKADRVYRIICIYICLIQAVSLIFITVTSKELEAAYDTYGSGSLQLTDNGILELASEENVVVFILDWFDEQILDMLLEADGEFLMPLDGFTRYTNASSQYAYTAMAVPYLLTGVEWEYNMSWHDYLCYAYENGQVLDDMKAAGYDLQVYTDAEYLGENALQLVENSEYFKYKTNIPNELYVMTNMARYQMAPFAAKQFYQYTTQTLQELAVQDGGIYSVSGVKDDMAVADYLDGAGLRTGDREKLFKLIHLHGAHPPFGVDESSDKPHRAAMLRQAKASMEIVYRYLEQMKHLGLYENATIIITADHGENYLYDPVIGRNELVKLYMERTSSPILLVKHPNQGTGIADSKAPVSQKELIAEIMNAVNPRLEGYGQTLEEIDEDEVRERIFIYKKGAKKYVKSRIVGDVSDPDNWEIMEGLNLEQLE